MSSTQRPRARELVPRERNPRQTAPESGESSARESDVEMEGNEEEGTTSVYATDAVYIDLRHTLIKPGGLSNNGRPKWKLSTAPRSNGQYPSPYRSLGHAELDPFNSTKLSRDDQALLHHCKI